MMTAAGCWPGTDQELARLRAAVERNCGCEFSVGPRMSATKTKVCEAHVMLESTDQRLLNHLLYAYRLRHRFKAAEAITT